MKCALCDAVNSAGTQFCSSCGAAFVAKKEPKPKAPGAKKPAAKKPAASKPTPAAPKTVAPKPVTPPPTPVAQIIPRSAKSAYLVCDACGQATAKQYSIQFFSYGSSFSLSTQDESFFTQEMNDSHIRRFYLPTVSTVVSSQMNVDPTPQIMRCLNCRAENSHHEKLLAPSEVKGRPRTYNPYDQSLFAKNPTNQGAGCFIALIFVSLPALAVIAATHSLVSSWV